MTVPRGNGDLKRATVVVSNVVSSSRSQVHQCVSCEGVTRTVLAVREARLRRRSSSRNHTSTRSQSHQLTAYTSATELRKPVVQPLRPHGLLSSLCNPLLLHPPFLLTILTILNIHRPNIIPAFRRPRHTPRTRRPIRPRHPHATRPHWALVNLSPRNSRLNSIDVWLSVCSFFAYAPPLCDFDTLRLCFAGETAR